MFTPRVIISHPGERVPPSKPSSEQTLYHRKMADSHSKDFKVFTPDFRLTMTKNNAHLDVLVSCFYY